MHCGERLRILLEAVDAAWLERRERRQSRRFYSPSPIRCNLSVELRRAGTGELIHQERVKNRVVGQGRAIVGGLILNVGPAPNYMAVGTGGTVSADDQDQLEAEVLRTSPSRKIAATSRAIFKLFLTSVDANQRFPGLSWTRSGTTGTITRTAHGLNESSFVTIEHSSDPAVLPNGFVGISGVTANTYNVPTVNAGATSGTCSEWNGKFLQEIGLFQGTNFSTGLQPLGGGMLFARATFTPLKKDSTIEATFTWDFLVTSSS